MLVLIVLVLSGVGTRRIANNFISHPKAILVGSSFSLRVLASTLFHRNVYRHFHLFSPRPFAPPPPTSSHHLPAGAKCGTVTSGTMAPCLKSAVSMAYVDTAHAALGTKLKAIVRGKPVDATVVKMPFVPNRYYKKP